MKSRNGQISEIIKCGKDPVYFMNKYLKIQHPIKGLIPFNTFELSRYERPSSSSVSNFREILKKAGFTVTVRTTRADDIGAACGQLVGTVADRTKRSVRYRTAIDTSDKKVKFVGKLAVHQPHNLALNFLQFHKLHHLLGYEQILLVLHCV